MKKGKFPPLNSRSPHIIHGGDYNPEQWIGTPETWDEDMRLMKLAGCNAMSVGIFAWAALEPSEGCFEFGWLDTIMDKLSANGLFAILATPSGSKPAWLSRAWPEVCRMNADGTRQPHGLRHNHCRTSPVYREKCRLINRRLAGRYADHPALIAWHVSNEYNGGDCFCPLCLDAFRSWLRKRYHDDLDLLNHAWWTAFWSHTFTEWETIEPTDPSIHGLMLDWQRFKTAQTIDFFRDESAPLRELTPDVPVTTNFMPNSPTLDYYAFAREVDIVSWDSYPRWHETGDDPAEAACCALLLDLNRSMKNGRPFMLMESTPSIATRCRIKKRKKPGMNLLSSLQAVAHGSDTVQYFQWRKGRGGSEKFHGAVVDHLGSEDTREFREVAEVGRVLAKLDAVVGTRAPAQVALVQDWENEWALEIGAGIYLAENVKYRAECASHYTPFWEAGIAVDVLDQTCPLEGYRLVLAPMAYLLRPGFAERLKKFVSGGGTAVMTCWSGVVDETDLCFLGGVPGDGLREVFGVREEESQNYFPGETVGFRMEENNRLAISGEYVARDICSVLRAEGATALATFSEDYFAGSPAITVNCFGEGEAYYLACRCDRKFLADFYGKLAKKLSLERAIEAELPRGVSARFRTDGQNRYIFLMNFNEDRRELRPGPGFTDLLTGRPAGPTAVLDAYGVMVLSKPEKDFA